MNEPQMITRFQSAFVLVVCLCTKAACDVSTHSDLARAHSLWAQAIVLDPNCVDEKLPLLVDALEIAISLDRDLARDIFVYLGDQGLLDPLCHEGRSTIVSLEQFWEHLSRDMAKWEFAEQCGFPDESVDRLSELLRENVSNISPIDRVLVQSCVIPIDSNSSDYACYALGAAFSDEKSRPLQRLACVTRGALCEKTLQRLLEHDAENGMTYLIWAWYSAEQGDFASAASWLGIAAKKSKWSYHDDYHPIAGGSIVPESYFSGKVGLTGQTVSPGILQTFLIKRAWVVSNLRPRHNAFVNRVVEVRKTDDIDAALIRALAIRAYAVGLRMMATTSVDSWMFLNGAQSCQTIRRDLADALALSRSEDAAFQKALNVDANMRKAVSGSDELKHVWRDSGALVSIIGDEPYRAAHSLIRSIQEEVGLDASVIEPFVDRYCN